MSAVIDDDGATGEAGVAHPSASEQRARRKRLKQERHQRIASMVRGRPELGPDTVHFDIANACNTRCTTCWHHSPFLAPEHRPSGAWKRQRLAFSDYARILDEVASLGGLAHVILSGMGDPTLNPELVAMVRHAHGHGLSVTIITNLLRADLDALLASPGELDLLTSICGVTPKSWQDFHAHPRPDGWQVLTKQLEQLRAVGFRPKHVQVINNANAHELVEMVEFAAEYPVKRVNFKLASLARGTEAVALSAHEKQHLRDELVPAAMAAAERLGVDTDLSAFARQIHPDGHATSPIAEVGCFMGYVYCRVTVEQELLYCCNTQVSIGQLGPDVSASELWRGSRYASIRSTLRRGAYFKGCTQCGKFKQNVKWHERLSELLEPGVMRSLYGGPPA